MKKLLAIIALGLLFSGNAYSDRQDEITNAKKLLHQALSKSCSKKSQSCKVSVIHATTRKTFVANRKTIKISAKVAMDSCKKWSNDYNLCLYYFAGSQGVINLSTKINGINSDTWKSPETIYFNSEKTNYNNDKKLLSNIKNTCMKFGYKEGTEKLADCMKELYVKQTTPVRNTIIQRNTNSSTKPKRKIDPTVWKDLDNISQGILRDRKSIGEVLRDVNK